MFPVATFNGGETLNEWEQTFEEVHRNGIIAFAICNYVRYTGDQNYLTEYGLKVLIAISRFWSQRVNISTEKKKYVILGVTGPNIYENNVNNNWFTNYIAFWTLKYTIECIEDIKKNNFHTFEDLCQEIKFNYEEVFNWKDIIENMYFPENKELGIFLQQDGFLDKQLIKAADIPESQRPINQHWTWDRILRSSPLRQADVLLGLYFFEEQFGTEVIKRNFDFYEPLTVHESSLSASTHSIIASAIGDKQKAYDLYVQTARLDLDDYNNDVADGLHISSMAGTWLAIVQGFGGMRVKENKLHLNPHIPEKWNAFAFNILFRNNLLNIRVEKDRTVIHNVKGDTIELYLNGKVVEILSESQREIKN